MQGKRTAPCLRAADSRPYEEAMEPRASARLAPTENGSAGLYRWFIDQGSDKAGVFLFGIAGLRCLWQIKQARNIRSGRKTQGSA